MCDLNNGKRFLESIHSGRVCIGNVVSLSDPIVSELLAEAGFDLTWIDLEHTALDLRSVLGHIMAVRGTKAVPFVRVAWNNSVLLKPILEMAPAAVIIPMVRSPDEAKRAVSACKYPPTGTRGFGPSRGLRYGAIPADEYLKTADSQTLVFLQIEHACALPQIRDIVATPGVDGVCVGPYDLSGSMGKLGQVGDPEVQAAVLEIIRITREHGKLAGIADYSTEGLERWINAGAQWINVGSDWYQLFKHSRSVLDNARAVLEKRSGY